MMGRSSPVHLRSRPRMYVIVFITCAMLALVLQWLVSATGELSSYADRRIQSAVDDAVHSQVTEAARDLDRGR